MRDRCNRWRAFGALAVAIVVGVLLLGGPTSGQTPAYRAARLRGTTNPNLNGIWQALNTANWNLEGHAAQARPAAEILGAYTAVPPGLAVVEGGGSRISRGPWRRNGRTSNTLMEHPRIRVLIAKVGLDGHDRGVKVVARTLRDARMDVIYTGLHCTPEEVVTAAMQKDVDVLGISILSGAHMTRAEGPGGHEGSPDAGDIPVVVGGVFPERTSLCCEPLESPRWSARTRRRPRSCAS